MAELTPTQFIRGGQRRNCRGLHGPPGVYSPGPLLSARYQGPVRLMPSALSQGRQDMTGATTLRAPWQPALGQQWKWDVAPA